MSFFGLQNLMDNYNKAIQNVANTILSGIKNFTPAPAPAPTPAPAAPKTQQEINSQKQKDFEKDTTNVESIKQMLSYVMIHYQDIVSNIDNINGKTYIRNNFYGDTLQSLFEQKSEFNGYYSRRNHQRRLYNKQPSKEYVIRDFTLGISPEGNRESWGVYFNFLDPPNQKFYVNPKTLESLLKNQMIVDKERQKLPVAPMPKPVKTFFTGLTVEKRDILVVTKRGDMEIMHIRTGFGGYVVTWQHPTTGKTSEEFITKEEYTKLQEMIKGKANEVSIVKGVPDWEMNIYNQKYYDANSLQDMLTFKSKKLQSVHKGLQGGKTDWMNFTNKIDRFFSNDARTKTIYVKYRESFVRTFIVSSINAFFDSMFTSTGQVLLLLYYVIFGSRNINHADNYLLIPALTGILFLIVEDTAESDFCFFDKHCKDGDFCEAKYLELLREHYGNKKGASVSNPSIKKNEMNYTCLKMQQSGDFTPYYITNRYRTAEGKSLLGFYKLYKFGLFNLLLVSLIMILMLGYDLFTVLYRLVMQEVT